MPDAAALCILPAYKVQPFRLTNSGGSDVPPERN